MQSSRSSSSSNLQLRHSASASASASSPSLSAGGAEQKIQDFSLASLASRSKKYLPQQWQLSTRSEQLQAAVGAVCAARLAMAWWSSSPFTGSVACACLLLVVCVHCINSKAHFKSEQSQKAKQEQEEKKRLQQREQRGTGLSALAHDLDHVLDQLAEDTEEDEDTVDEPTDAEVEEADVAAAIRGGIATLQQQNRSFPPDFPAARFIEATKGDVPAALERWAKTKAWRKENNIDTVLLRPHPRFEECKAGIGHFFHKTDKHGHTVYFERPRLINLSSLKQAGITHEDLQHHFIYLYEYIYTVLNKDTPDNPAKVLSVLDMKGLGFRFFAGEAMKLLRSTTKIAQDHYPVRSCKILLINSPLWFSSIWKVISQWIDERTRSKLFIYSGPAREQLLELIDEDSLPALFGGACTCGGQGCATDSPEETGLRHFVAKSARNKDHMAELGRGPPITRPSSSTFSSGSLQSRSHSPSLQTPSTSSSSKSLSPGSRGKPLAHKEGKPMSRLRQSLSFKKHPKQ